MARGKLDQVRHSRESVILGLSDCTLLGSVRQGLVRNGEQEDICWLLHSVIFPSPFINNRTISKLFGSLFCIMLSGPGTAVHTYPSPHLHMYIYTQIIYMWGSVIRFVLGSRQRPLASCERLVWRVLVICALDPFPLIRHW